MVEQENEYTPQLHKKAWKKPEIILISTTIENKIHPNLHEGTLNQANHNGKTYISNGTFTYTGTRNEAIS